EIAKRLIGVSDIVIENFSSRVLRNWGLGYEELRRIKPDIVYVSSRVTVIPAGVTITRLSARSRRQSPDLHFSPGCQTSRQQAGAGRIWTIPAACTAPCAR